LFNFIFSDGTASKLDVNGKVMEEVKMQVSGGAVKRVVICYDQSEAYLVGLQMFDSDNTLLLEAVADYYGDYNHKEWILEDKDLVALSQEDTLLTTIKFEVFTQGMLVKNRVVMPNDLGLSAFH
jgi:hypothetical protein